MRVGLRVVSLYPGRQLDISLGRQALCDGLRKQCIPWPQTVDPRERKEDA
jgi:hypothetical protein